MSFLQPGNGGFAIQPACWGQVMGQGNPPFPCGHPVRTDPVQVSFRVPAGHIVFGKGRQLLYPYPLPDSAAFFRHHLKRVVMAKPDLLLPAIQGKPFRPFPAIDFGKDRPLVFQHIIQWSRSSFPPRGPFLSRQVQFVHVLIIFMGLGLGIPSRSKPPKPPGVHPQHVDLGITVNHPLGKVFSGTRPRCDANGCPVAMPEISQPCRRTQKGVAVRGMWNGPANRPLDSKFPPHRDTLHDTLDIGHDILKIRVKQFIFGIPFRPATTMGPALLGVFHFIDSDQTGFLLLAVIR